LPLKVKESIIRRQKESRTKECLLSKDLFGCRSNKIRSRNYTTYLESVSADETNPMKNKQEI